MERLGARGSLNWAPSQRTTRDLIDALAARGDAPAVAEVTGGRLQTHGAGELARLALALASGLAGEGVTPGTPVLLLAENGYAWVAARLAIGAAGAVAVALDPLAGREEIGAAWRATQARHIFTTTAHLADLGDETRSDADAPRIYLLEDEVPEGRPDILDWRTLAAQPGAALPLVAPDSPAMMVYTSGTTGRPKRFLLSSDQLWANIPSLRDSGLVRPGDRVLLPLPLHHAYPLVIGLLTALECGAMVVFPEAVTGHGVVEALGLSRATVIVGVPRLYVALLAALEGAVAARSRLIHLAFRLLLGGCVWLRRHSGWSPGGILFRGLRARVGPGLRLLVSGGARLDQDLSLKLEALGWNLRSGYGLAETAAVFTANLPGATRLGSEGRPIGAGALRIAAPSGAESVGDGSGEIELRGPSLFTGYLDNSEADAAAFAPDGWFRTGDLGYLDGAGFLHVTGRLKELLVLGGGKKVLPEDIERALAASPFCTEIAVLEREGRLVALIVPNLAAIRASGAAEPAVAIRISLAELSAGLPAYARPAGFALTREALPRTRLGKYRRFLLPPLYDRALTQAEAPQEEPLSAPDRALLAEPEAQALWSLLGERFPGLPLHMDSSLQLDLGLDSLGWMGLALEIEGRLGLTLSDAAAARIITIRDLLREAVAARGAGPPPQPVEAEQSWLRRRGVGLSALGALLFLLNRLVFFVAFGLRAKARAHIPAEGPCILAPNHASYLDAPALAAVLPWHAVRRVHWAADRTLMFSGPLRRLFSRAGGLFPVDQRSPAAALAAGAAILRQGQMLVWFPEGWRSPDGVLLPFQPGIGRLLRETGAPVVPVHIEGAFESLPRGRWFPRFRRITVVFGPPIAASVLALDAAGDEAERLRARYIALFGDSLALAPSRADA